MNVVKRYRAVVGVMAGVVLLSLAACATDAKEYSATDLIHAIEASAERSVSLGSVYTEDAAFDRAVNICPYMDAREVEQALGFAWVGTAKLALDDESRGSILLVQGDRVNAIIPLVRTEIDLCTAPAEPLIEITAQQSLKFARGAEAGGATGWTMKHD